MAALSSLWEDGSIVTVSYTVFLESACNSAPNTQKSTCESTAEEISSTPNDPDRHVIDSSQLRGQELTFQIGSKLALPEIEHAVRRLPVGGEATLSLPATAILTHDRRCALGLADTARLEVRLALASATRAADLVAAGAARAAEAAARHKAEGNRLHAEGEYADAAAEYRRAEQLLAPYAAYATGGGKGGGAPAAAALRAAALSVALNLAACHLKLAGAAGDGAAARAEARRAARRCAAALRLDGASVKARFRRAQAAVLLGDAAAAAADLRVGRRRRPAARRGERGCRACGSGGATMPGGRGGRGGEGERWGEAGRRAAGRV